MKHFILLLTMVAGSATTTLAQNKSDAILGEWLSAKKDTRVLIYRQENRYYGKITWGTGASTKDEKNPNPAFRDRDVVGLAILRDFAYDGDDTWEGGSIYDPREGKVYACKMTLKNANSLHIRGFVGVSLFGRSEVWSRCK
ncbi:MAG: DUF2147 domain-containing protein [Ferruginibacter sp.]|nr:DUF2147 domain-containing protein [Cytophagales bacterium]